jgi:Cdc6-like AAA superfamily ATPase
MSDRLKFFRRLMSAFEGTSNPQRAVERGFYVNLPNNPVGEITGRVALRPSSMHLLFGGIGSGKTTQLLSTQTALNGLEDIKAIYVDVSLVTDISDLQSGALIAIAGLELIKILGNVEKPELQKFKQVIEKSAYGYSETKSIQTGFSSAMYGLTTQQVTTHHKGLLSPEKQENRSLILEAFSRLNKAVQEVTKKEIIFIFDSLDRLSNSEVFIDSALDDVVEINNVGSGVVLVGSVATLYEERDSISGIEGYSYFLPYLDVIESVEAQNFFTDVLTIRDTENFINSELRLFLISKSGGVLRDLMSLCQASIEEAYVDGSDQITEQHANQAVLAMARSKLIGLTDSNMDVLRKVMTEVSFSPRTSEDFELLLTGHILEYRHPRQRFVVHPILVPLIERMLTNISHV